MRTVNQPLTVPTAEVDLDAIGHNVRILREHAGSAQVMAVVKADGYGHGAVEAGRAALGAGAAELGVATVGEALELPSLTEPAAKEPAIRQNRVSIITSDRKSVV